MCEQPAKVAARLLLGVLWMGTPPESRLWHDGFPAPFPTGTSLFVPNVSMTWSFRKTISAKAKLFPVAIAGHSLK